jgi:energy-coupling factor transporter ATP-binding protein EcfA2
MNVFGMNPKNWRVGYLRIIGDYGSGKSRLLKVLNICYKSIYTSGNASEAPIFRLMHKYGGTLIIDEDEPSVKMTDARV